MSNQHAKGPLNGLKVIELCHAMSGPVCGLMLADLGADVIKIERYPGGDMTRETMRPAKGGDSDAFRLINRNKRSVAIDLKSEKGMKCLKQLAEKTDVLAENFRPGSMQRLGLDYDELQKSNPGLIYCQITGFGRTGPYSHMPGFDLIAQGMSGLMSITGERDSDVPIRCGPPVTDITAGLLAALGILSAYIQRLKTGRGQRVDTSIFEAGIIQSYWHAALYFSSGQSPGAFGSSHIFSAPYQAFETADGWINVGAASEENWQRLLDVLEKPELGSDPRYARNIDRMQNLSSLEQELTQIFKTQTKSEWLEKLMQAGVPAGPILSTAEVLTDPQTIARNMIIHTPDDKGREKPSLGCPIKFSDTQLELSRTEPQLGEHTMEVLLENGLNRDHIELLLQEGCLYDKYHQ